MLPRRARTASRSLLAGVVLASFAASVGRAAATPAGPEASELVPPHLVQGARVSYPDELAALPEPPAGVVTIGLTIGTDGVPHSLEVIEGVHPRLDALALEAAAQLRFAPATLGGEAVEISTRIPIELSPPTPAPPEDDDEAPPAEAAPPTSSTEDAASESSKASAKTATLRGRLLAAGDRAPIGGASVVIVPASESAPVGPVDRRAPRPESDPAWERTTFTAPTGEFELGGLEPGKIRVVVLAAGFERVEFIEEVQADGSLTVRYFVPRSYDDPYRTVVRSERPGREEIARKRISREEITNLPGTQGDALKSVTNFPGIARPPFGIGLLVIRGADPTDSVVYLGEHEIPQLFHFGGLTSVFNSDVITDIDYIPGNFDARYGDAIGGVIDVHTRPGSRDGVHGYVDADLFDAGAMVEGPVGEGSYVLSVRRSYIDALLPVVIPDDAGLDLTVAPRYWDYQALFDHPATGGNLSVKVFGSDDRSKVVSSDPNEVEIDDTDRFENTFIFHRVDVAYEHHEKSWDVLVTPSYRYDFASLTFSDLFRFDLTAHTGSLRAEIGHQVSPKLRWDVGTQVVGGLFTFDAQSPPVPVEGTGSTGVQQRIDSADTFFAPAVYGTVTIEPTPALAVLPGVRINMWGVLDGRASIDPRLRARWHVGERTTLRGGVGLFSQVPDAPEWNETFGNPDVRPERALHASLGVRHDFEYDVSLEVNGFYKSLWDLAAPSERLVSRDGVVRPENFASQGRGRIFGGEVFVRKELTRNFFGWLSYTISRSQRKERSSEPWVLFDLDQTHILTLLGVYRLSHGWQVGGRFRLVSGNPYTPAVGSTFDPGTGDYIPIWGPDNSRRVPLFHQLDLRVDKRWVFRRVMLNLYADVQNVYNRRNAEFINYSYDFGQTQFIPSLPIIPSLGVRLEW